MTPDAASHRRALRWTLAGFGVFVLVVGGILAWARFGPNSRHAFDEAVARAEAAGLAVRVEDLPEWDAAAARAGSAEFDYAMLALDAAGPPWRSGLTGPWDYDVERPWYEHAGAERIEALRGWLSANEKWLDDLSRAAGSGEFQVDYRDGRIPRVQNLNRILEASMIADPDPARRLRAATTCLQIGDGIVPADWLGTGLGLATRGLGLRGLRRELAAASVPALRVAAALDAARLRERGDAWRGVLLATIAAHIEDARPITPIKESIKRTAPVLHSGMTYKMHATEIDFLVRGQNSAAGEFRASRAALLDAAAAAWPPDAAEAALYVRVHQRQARHDAELRLFRLALAATVRRERDGRWPASLAELAPDVGGTVPVDPTTGTAFIYVVTDGTMRIEVPADSDLRTDPDSRETDAPAVLAERGLVIEVTR